MALSRRGSYLVVSRATPMLPNFCVKCGEPGSKTLRKTFLWHNPTYYLLILLCSPLIYAIVAQIVGRKMPLGISLCKRHASRRFFLILLGSILLLGSIPIGIFLGANPGITIGIVGTLAGLVVLVVATNTIRPIKMTDSEATFAGVGEAFLSRVAGKG
jgi:hypothetical protein